MLQELQDAFASIDRLVNVSIRARGMPAAQMSRMYNLVEQALGKPVCAGIVERLLDSSPGARIGIVQGFMLTEHMPGGENDGPLGAAALGRCLKQLGFDATIYTDEPLVPVSVEMCAALGASVPVHGFDLTSPNQLNALAEDLDVAFAIERIGVNQEGILHTALGNAMTNGSGRVDHLFITMLDHGKLTVGIGDVGNEIGFGNLYEEARTLLPYGRKCRCGCGQGIITTTKTSICYPVAVSNWGAYGIVAALALLTGNPSLLLSPEEEVEMIQRALALDCRDGGTGLAIPAVDGVSCESSAAVVRLLGDIVSTALSDSPRNF